MIIEMASALRPKKCFSMQSFLEMFPFIFLIFHSCKDFDSGVSLFQLQILSVFIQNHFKLKRYLHWHLNCIFVLLTFCQACRKLVYTDSPLNWYNTAVVNVLSSVNCTGDIS